MTRIGLLIAFVAVVVTAVLLAAAAGVLSAVHLMSGGGL